MRWFCVVALGMAAASLSALSYDEAQFFAARTGYGSPAELVYRFAPLSRAAAVDLVLAHLDDAPVVPDPAWVNPPFGPPETKEARKSELRTWFLANAIQSPWPLGEKVVLFWHNHLPSSLEKLDNGELLFQQDRLYRKLGTGALGPFLKAVTKDPSMLIYLDGQDNTQGKPNENYARELFELFTLGEGHYTEADIKEAARALTGWTVDRKTATATFNPKRFDAGSKTVFGVTGPLDADGLVDLVLAQDRTAVFLTEKLWRYFVSMTPDPDRVKVLAAAYRSSGYQFKTLLRGLLLEPAFWDPANRRSLVKSPMDLVVGQIRTWGLVDVDLKRTVGQLGRLGQDLFNPLSVKGWPEGLGWVDSATLLERRRVLADLANGFRKQWQLPASQLQ